MKDYGWNKERINEMAEYMEGLGKYRKIMKYPGQEVEKVRLEKCLNVTSQEL